MADLACDVENADCCSRGEQLFRRLEAYVGTGHMNRPATDCGETRDAVVDDKCRCADRRTMVDMARSAALTERMTVVGVAMSDNEVCFDGPMLARKWIASWSADTRLGSGSGSGCSSAHD